MRIGIGYDVHRLAEERKLILGGVEIPYDKGLLGHSDADVLLHAVMDALLGAAAAGDIGKHFPDSDPKYKGISSMRLLEYVKELLDEKCYYVHNIDATIIAQKPKLAPFLPEMVKNICSILEISKNQVNIKATTEEGLGFTGQGQGIAAHAVCTLEEIDNYFYGEEEQTGRCRGCRGCQGCQKNQVIDKR
jgi:2-C-methyl-D-erythritol 2,4-cyclodiphosphate synthase